MWRGFSHVERRRPTSASIRSRLREKRAHRTPSTLPNWRPVAVYGLLLFFCGGVVPGLAVALIKLMVPPQAAIYMTLLIVFPYFCLFVAAQTISDYIAYRDIFHAGEVSEAASVA